MSDDVQRPGPGPTSIAELIESVVATVAEIGWSLFAAGKGMVAIASRLVRLAQERVGLGEGAARGSGLEPAPAGSPELPPNPPPPTAAAALDREVVAEHRPPERPAPTAMAVGGADAGRIEEASPPLPDRYGVDLLVVLPRDPGTAFAWWEVTDATRSRALAELDRTTGDVEEPREALRVQAVDATTPAGANGGACSWMIELPPRSARRYELVLGLLAAGRFVPLLSPVTVELPVDDVSSDDHVRWRVVGDPIAGYVVGLPRPSAEATARLLAELRGAAAPSSDAWRAGRRLVEVGASHALPLG